jgi:Immunity protein 26
MTGPRPAVGDVVEIALPDGTFAYGRVLKDACVAFYRERSTAGQQPPIGSRDFEFIVGVYDDALRRWSVVGHDPSATDDENWPPPFQIEDVISGEHRIYERGETRPAIGDEWQGLERAAVSDERHVVDRLLGHRPGSL